MRVMSGLLAWCPDERWSAQHAMQQDVFQPHSLSVHRTAEVDQALGLLDRPMLVAVLREAALTGRLITPTHIKLVASVKGHSQSQEATSPKQDAAKEASGQEAPTKKDSEDGNGNEEAPAMEVGCKGNCGSLLCIRRQFLKSEVICVTCSELGKRCAQCCCENRQCDRARIRQFDGRWRKLLCFPWHIRAPRELARNFAARVCCELPC